MTKKSLSDLLREEQPHLTEPLALTTAMETVRSKRVLTKADLEVQIQELQTALSQAQAAYQDLQTTTQAREARITAELAQVQKEALQLAQANTRMAEELKKVHQPTVQQSIMVPGAPFPAPAIANPNPAPLHVRAIPPRPIWTNAEAAAAAKQDDVYLL